jgi:hypothetical protein
VIIGVSDRKRIKGAERVVCEDVEWVQLILEKVTLRASEID